MRITDETEYVNGVNYANFDAQTSILRFLFDVSVSIKCIYFAARYRKMILQQIVLNFQMFRVLIRLIDLLLMRIVLLIHSFV